VGCDARIARLDSEGVGGLSPGDREHARACAACGAALRAAERAEALLRAAPPSPGASFTGSVMARVEATERARRRLVESERPSVWSRWWTALAEEPAALVVMALAPALFGIATVWPESLASLVAFLRDASATLIASVARGARTGGVDPLARAVSDAFMLSAVCGMLYFGLQWAGDVFGGSVTSARRAHRESTSRRRPS